MPNSYLSPSGDDRIDSLLTGSRWGVSTDSVTQLTYSFPSGAVFSDYLYSHEYTSGWFSFNSAQQNYAEQALQGWAELANISFTQVTDNANTHGDIRFAYSYALPSDTAAWAYTPDVGYNTFGNTINPTDAAGDVWFNPDISDLSKGTEGYATLMHELGHALGLKHTFKVEGRFPALDTALDDEHYSVMSYTGYEGAGYHFSGSQFSYSYWPKSPSTPMLYDVLAIQSIYGANTTTRTGDDTYTFLQDAELKTIWDAGGIDTFDFSNQLEGVNISLINGTFSDVGQRQIAYQGPKTLAEDNIAIAFGTTIENVIGSNYNDVMTGNEINNLITGGLGNDTLDGGEGDDTAIFIAPLTYYSFEGTVSSATVTGVEGTDLLKNIEQLQFSDGTYTLESLLNNTNTQPIPTQESEIDYTPDEGGLAYFLLALNSALTSDAHVQYNTKDGSAIAGEDYIATSGIATIAAGMTQVTVSVQILDDELIEDPETFYLSITDPSGVVLGNSQIELLAQRTIVDTDSLI